MNPACSPLAGALFAQWQRARGHRMDPAARPFSRGWEDLLEAAGLLSATERGDAERDARALVAEGWLELRTVRYRPHLIERIVLPLPAELRWGEAFGFLPPTDEEARRVREFAWEPALQFVREARLNIPFEDLRRLNEFLQTRGRCADRERELIPIKERSLQLFGEEKRLDALVGSALFRESRLELERDLGCALVGVPLAWRRGPAAAAERPLLVIENAATWHSYCRWNAERAGFSATVYGEGSRFLEGVGSLKEIFAELGGERRVFYFGDLDWPGLQIPQGASARAVRRMLPAVEPHLWSYGRLLDLGAGLEQPWGGEGVGAEAEAGEGEVMGHMDKPDVQCCDWLGPWAEPARRLIRAGQRLPQEHVGWEFLRELAEMV